MSARAKVDISSAGRRLMRRRDIATSPCAGSRPRGDASKHPDLLERLEQIAPLTLPTPSSLRIQGARTRYTCVSEILLSSSTCPATTKLIDVFPMSSKARSDSVDLDTKSVSLPAEPPSPLLVDPPSRKGTTWLGALWDTFDLPRDERRLLVKIDASLLIFASLGYFIKCACPLQITVVRLSSPSRVIFLSSEISIRSAAPSLVTDPPIS